jgi:hypothetical protein
MTRTNLKIPRARVVFGVFLVPFFFACGQGGESGKPDLDGAAIIPAETNPDRLEVTRLAYEFMEALSARNTDRLDELMAPHARLFSIREGEEGAEYRVRTREEFLEGLSEEGPDFVERIWEPVVELRDRIGMVWAPYDFHVDGELTHCGIDVLAFLKMDEGWKVTSITYNLVRDDCPVSPLGPGA